MAEKVGSSFHVAIGDCYQWTAYAGVHVHVNNGNLGCGVHWDLPVLMHPGSGGGRIELDPETENAEIIQVDGSFLNPQLAVLNPQKCRPATESRLI